MNSDRWRLISICPVCLADCHLEYDAGANDRCTPRLPHARYRVHQDSLGKECWMSRREAVPWDETSTRAAVHGRSQGVCEYCQRNPASEMHHRISRGAGGGWYPSNILHLCTSCHHQVTVQPAWAQSLGLSVKASAGVGPELVSVVREDGTTLRVSDDVAPPPARKQGGAQGPTRKRKRGPRAKDADRGSAAVRRARRPAG